MFAMRGAMSLAPLQILPVAVRGGVNCPWYSNHM